MIFYFQQTERSRCARGDTYHWMIEAGADRLINKRYIDSQGIFRDAMKWGWHRKALLFAHPLCILAALRYVRQDYYLF